MKHYIPNLDIHSTNACNLSCEQCTHLSNYGLNELYSPDQLEDWYKAWYRRLFPRTISLSGGEPLINKKISDILYLTKKYWPDSFIRLFSNGLLLYKNQHILDILKELNIGLIVSYHSVNGKYPDYDTKFDKCVEILKEYSTYNDVDYIIEGYNSTQSHQTIISNGRLIPNIFFDDRANLVLKFENTVNWYRFYKDFGSNMKPYNSDDFQSSWNNCPVYQTCFQLQEYDIYKCAPLTHIKSLNKKYKLSEEWDPYLKYEPLKPTATDMDIVNFFNKKAESYCSMCPKEPIVFTPDKDPTKKISFYPKYNRTD